jgi:peptidoglycan hydrolase-like protein with peptidoglycan-binding domain
MVRAAQRALVKLGFVLNPDGLAGAATRHAITRYERDHGLAVHGEVTPALVRRLSAETGITID